MSQRTRAGVIAACLLAVLCVVAAFTSLPYVTYRPGPTVDILAEAEGEEMVQVSGHEAYHDDGELRLTTIYVDDPQARVSLLDVLKAYFDPDEAVYPRAVQYAPGETDESDDRRSAVAMVSSQDSAVATALTELGYEVDDVVEVLDVVDGSPAEGRLEVRDVLVEVGGAPVSSAQDVVDAVDTAPADKPIEFVVRRDGEEVTVQVTPRVREGEQSIGISLGPGHTFPFDVKVDIGDGIGGPSAGLMMALAVYDTLTPGSLTGGHSIAGTGTITRDGEVGSIGGIQQKIAASRDAGSELFLVPPDNCDSVADVDTDDMRLVRADTLHDAIQSIEAWVEDPDATLPTCEDPA